jgi:predicted permease
MFETIIAALLPIVVTLFLGFFAGWHHDFDAKQGAILNRMVMLYALPLSLFAGMMGIDRGLLLEQGAMLTLLSTGMILGYVVVFLLARYVFRRPVQEAALLALAIAGPAVPFVGVPVLGFLFKDLSSVPIAVCSILMNLVQVPITLFILSRHSRTLQNTSPAQSVSVLKNIRHTLKEPVVWAPILGFVLLLLGLSLPKDIRSSMQLLGGATGGVALFASGVILFSYKVALNPTVAIAVLIKNVAMPVLIMLLGMALGMHTEALNITVITLAIPTASICVILAVQYQTAEQEIASILFFSTLLSIITMGGFLYCLT